MDRIDTFKTIDVLALALLIAYLAFGLPWLLWIAMLLVFGNAFESRITARVAASWMKVAAVIGNFNTRIILSIMFFVILTPIALAYRLLNRDLVDHFRENRRPSYFDDVHKKYVKSDFEKLW
ncbi:MAG: SxtJ family membrane protein [Pseudomonadota bacterium]